MKMNICEDVDVDGDHYVNDGDPQEGVRRLVPLCGRFTRRCKACPSPCKTSGPCLQYPSSILSIGCRQGAKLIYKLQTKYKIYLIYLVCNARHVHRLAKHQVRNSNFIHHIPSPLVADVCIY